jgi:hypothetical protein
MAVIDSLSLCRGFDSQAFQYQYVAQQQYYMILPNKTWYYSGIFHR